MFYPLNFSNCLPVKRTTEIQDTHQAFSRISLTQEEDTFEHQTEEPKQIKSSKLSEFVKKYLLECILDDCQTRPEDTTLKETISIVKQCCKLSLNFKKKEKTTGEKMQSFSIKQLNFFRTKNYSKSEIKFICKILNKFKKDKETKFEDLTIEELKTLIKLVNNHEFSKDIRDLYSLDEFNKNFRDALWGSYTYGNISFIENLDKTRVCKHLSGILVKKTKLNLKKLPSQTQTALKDFSIKNTCETLKSLELPKTSTQSSMFKLKYKFENLKEDIENILKNVNIEETQKNEILETLQNTVQSLLFNEPIAAFKNLPSEIQTEINEKINKYLSEDNVIFSNNQKIPDALKEIFKAIPALITTIGRKQDGHSFTVDTHIIAVAQAVINNNAFNTLNDNDKKNVLLASLMHDITKMNGGQDPSHPIISAKYAYNMLKRAGFEDDSCNIVMNLIYCHHFGETVAKKNDNEITTLAYECSTVNSENFMKMLQILGEADIKGNPATNQKHVDECKNTIEGLTTKKAEITEALSELKKQLALTPFPKLSEYIQPEQTEMIEGVNVINLSNEPNLSDIKLLVHGISNTESIQGIENLTSEYKPDAILSTSDINLNNVKLFENCQCGFVMDPENTTILKQYAQNACTGVKKPRDLLGEFINQPDATTSSKTEKNSEVLVTDFQVNAVFMTEQKYKAYKGGAKEEILEGLIQFAKKHNLPLIVIPNSK